MDSVQRGGGRGQHQIQTFLKVFLVKVKYCSNVLGHLEFYRNCLLKTRDNKIIIFWCTKFRGVKKSVDRIHTFIIFF